MTLIVFLFILIGHCKLKIYFEPLPINVSTVSKSEKAKVAEILSYFKFVCKLLIIGLPITTANFAEYPSAKEPLITILGADK